MKNFSVFLCEDDGLSQLKKQRHIYFFKQNYSKMLTWSFGWLLLSKLQDYILNLRETVWECWMAVLMGLSAGWRSCRAGSRLRSWNAITALLKISRVLLMESLYEISLIEFLHPIACNYWFICLQRIGCCGSSRLVFAGK